MDDDGLFADLRPIRSEKPQPIPEPESLADWQVAQVRKALDVSGLNSMAERKGLIEELVGRSVGALRELTASEARAVLEALRSRMERADSARSSWEERDEDTWIDRL